MHNRYLNVVGIGVILFIAWLFSHKRSHINYRLVTVGLFLQGVIGFFVLKTTIGRRIVEIIAFYVKKLYQFADEGSGFVFGSLVNDRSLWGVIFAFKVLPVIIFFGAFMSLLFYFNIVQRIVVWISLLIRPLLGTSGSETLCAIANSFLGQTEAPLLIRHYLKNMTRSEMLVVMVSGMATISGAILVVFAQMGVPTEHLLASSVMSIPASLVIAKILLPETEHSAVRNDVTQTLDSRAKNVFDAIAVGTTDGLHLAVNVGAMLISFLAFLAMINFVLSYGAYKVNFLIIYLNKVLATSGGTWQIDWRIPALTIEKIFGILFSPFGYLLGFTGDDALHAGELIGTKIALNEVIAYKNLTEMNLSERATNIITYALCGFSNFSCIGIQIGGIGALVPERRDWLTQLGLYAVLGGALSNLLSAMIAGILL